LKKIISYLIVVFALISCNETKKEITHEKPATEKQELAAVYKSVEVEIEGMTCEIGCAKLIESKLSKVDGVTFSKVDFEAKKGLFTYDENKLSKNDITQKINGIAGGDLYLVTKTVDIEEIIPKTY
jgi:Cu+-exporting ATPase